MIPRLYLTDNLSSILFYFQPQPAAGGNQLIIYYSNSLIIYSLIANSLIIYQLIISVSFTHSLIIYYLFSFIYQLIIYYSNYYLFSNYLFPFILFPLLRYSCFANTYNFTLYPTNPILSSLYYLGGCRLFRVVEWAMGYIEPKNFF